MQPDFEYLRRHYASLSDEALRAIDRSQLVDAARQCYDVEVATRKLKAPEYTGPSAFKDVPAKPGDHWLDEAACVGVFADYPGSDAGPSAEDARRVLETAGIPSRVNSQEVAPEPPRDRQLEYRVMVPGGLHLQALSVLDKEIYNPRLEADWKAHLEELSDEDFRGINPDVICAGMQDRIDRLKKVYQDEVARRGDARYSR